MNNIIIFLFILVANVIAFLLIYNSFNKNVEKTKQLLYTMISMGIVYIVVLVIYFFSSIGLSKEVTSQAREMITFSFVPVNSIIILPFLGITSLLITFGLYHSLKIGVKINLNTL